ncbi:MBL fold metallo-hydrolase [Candidatus Pacebacteria bacterium]|nr:MBL fold metallo-hydrolase [Candidatus Paceibacterota bacterium]
MKIQKFEQSGFIIEKEDGYKIAIDIGAYTPVEKLQGIKVDSMIVSHLHGDHFSVEQIKVLEPKKLYLSRECIDLLEEELESEIIEIKTSESLDISGIKVDIFDVDHGPNISVVPKENFGLLLEIEGKKIYFAGDMFNESGMAIDSLEVDYALIPVGTFYTFGPQEALNFIKKFKMIGKIIPMHYQKKPETKEEFIEMAEGEGFEIEKL